MEFKQAINYLGENLKLKIQSPTIFHDFYKNWEYFWNLKNSPEYKPLLVKFSG